MQGVTFHGPHDFRFESVEDPKPRAATDAVVRVTRTTICGSDLHLWHGGMPVADRGFTVGHEFVGVVDEVGSAVESVSAGDRVLISCTIGYELFAERRDGVLEIVLDPESAGG